MGTESQSKTGYARSRPRSRPMPVPVASRPPRAVAIPARRGRGVRAHLAEQGRARLDGGPEEGGVPVGRVVLAGGDVHAERLQVCRDLVPRGGGVGGAGEDFGAGGEQRLEVGDHLEVEVADDEEALVAQGGEGLGGCPRGRGEAAEPVQFAGEVVGPWGQGVLPLR